MKTAAVLCCCLALLDGCKIIPTADKHEAASLNSAQAPDKGFDAKVADLWPTKVIPYAQGKAGKFQDVQAAVAANANQGGAKYGYREKGDSNPWTMVAQIDGKIVAANTESRASTIDVDVDGDGKADLQIQIGPVIRGTSIRDVLDFVSFNDFTNQIDFAQFGKAFNTYINDNVLKLVSRDGLVGKSVSALGAYPLPMSGLLPLVTPLKIEVK